MPKKLKKRKTAMESKNPLNSSNNSELLNSPAKKSKKLKFDKSFWKNPSVIVFVILFAAIGSILLIKSFAATPLQGTVVDTIYELDAKNPKEEHRYFLHTDNGKRYQIKTSDTSKLQAGSKVSLNGSVSNSQVTVSTSNDITVLQAASTASLPQNMMVAVMLVNYNTDPQQPFTVDQAKKNFFTDTNSVANYYRENSYGKLNLSGDVFGWFTAPAPTSSGGICNTYLTTDEATRQAANQGVNLASYNKIVWVFPTCGGIADFGGTNAYTSWGDFGVNAPHSHTEHEFGHTLGFGHAHSLSCVDSLSLPTGISNNCTQNEYGDRFDVMGNGTGHMTAQHKTAAGWLDPANVKSTSASGDFTLAPYETPSTGIQSLQVFFARRNVAYYNLEYHTDYGFDSGQSGVVIRFNDPVENPVYTNMYAPLPGSSNGSLYVRPGTSFLDRAHGLTISVVSKTATGALIRVKFGKIATSQDAASCLGVSGPAQVTAGTNFNISLTYKNTGKSTWSAPGYGVNWLLLRNSASQPIPTINRIGLPTTVSPGQTITLTQSLKAPASYFDTAWDLSWRLANEPKNEYFGDVCRVSVNLTQLNRPDTTPPGIPTNVQVTQTSSSTANVTWAYTGTDNNGGGFKVYRKTDPLTSFMIDGYANSYERSAQSSVVVGKTYSYYVTNYDAYGNESAPSATFTIQIK